MKIWGITEDQAMDVMDQLNGFFYGGNLMFNRYPEEFGKRIKGVNCTLRVMHSDEAGARRAPSGRRTVAADYEAHYTFMEAIFAINPEARIKTAMEDYRGIGEFYAKAPAVADLNVGSMMAPVAFGDL